jgi:hypothetical protein
MSIIGEDISGGPRLSSADEAPGGGPDIFFARSLKSLPGNAGFTPVPPGGSTDSSSKDAGDTGNVVASMGNSRSLHATRRW